MMAGDARISVCVGGIASGLLVAAAIAPMDYGVRMFAFNFAHYWLPQAVIIGLLFGLRLPGEQIGGFAIALALYLLGYYLWVISKNAGGLIWIGYTVSILGAAVSAIVMRLLAPRIRRLGVPASTAVGFLMGLVGVATGLTGVWLTFVAPYSKA